jgi:hypothetical protein
MAVPTYYAMARDMAESSGMNSSDTTAGLAIILVSVPCDALDSTSEYGLGLYCGRPRVTSLGTLPPCTQNGSQHGTS